VRRKEIVDLAQINAILEHAFTSLHCFATKDTNLASQPASVQCKPKSEVTTHSKRQGTLSMVE